MSHPKTLFALKFICALALGSTLSVTAGCTTQIGEQSELGVDGGSSGENKELPICDEAVDINFEQKTRTPDILVILDRSGSMGDPLQNRGQTKWNIIKPALGSIVSDKGAQVNFGLMLFPWGGDCGAGSVRVSPVAYSDSAILEQMASTGPSGGTPTHQSLSRAKDHFNQNPVNPDGRVILLATDGIPTCYSSINDSVTVINQLQGIDIKTYVLGFNSGNVNLTNLNQMAVAGGTGQMYTADSPEQLSTALDTIIGEITVPSCEFQLNQTPANEADINVSINGHDLKRDDPNGWSYDSITKVITLLGTSCEIVENGNTNGIDVDLGCGGNVID